MGIIKPKSLMIKSGTTDINFVLTDLKNEIEVFYTGKENDNFVSNSFL
jgi:cytochrome c-type biogenesis protein CcmE